MSRKILREKHRIWREDRFYVNFSSPLSPRLIPGSGFSNIFKFSFNPLVYMDFCIVENSVENVNNSL